MEERTLLTSFCEIITVGGLSPLVIATLCWLTAAFVCVAVWKAVASAQNVAEVPFGSVGLAVLVAVVLAACGWGIYTGC